MTQRKAERTGQRSGQISGQGSEKKSGQRQGQNDSQRDQNKAQQNKRVSGNHTQGRSKPSRSFSQTIREQDKRKHGRNQASGGLEGLRPGQTILVTIKRLGINGEGIGYYKKKVVFIPKVLPEEEVVAEVKEVKPGYATAEVIRIKKKSPDRQKAICPVYDKCGGCQLQHLQYPAQLKEKREHVIQALQKYTKISLDKIKIHPTIGMDDPWGYRNKAQWQVGLVGQDLIAGLYAEGSHQLIDLSSCPVQHPQTNRVMEEVKGILQELKISIYNERKHKGIVRTIVARLGFETGELQLVIVTRSEELPHQEQLVAAIRQKLPEVKSIVQNIQPEKSSIIFGDQSRLLWGNERIEEKLGTLSFSLSPRAFFQLNPEQTVKLYNTVKQYAELTGHEKIVDAYCGVGTIGMWLADGAAEVRGMDIIPEAIEDAQVNAEKSGLNNAHYYVGKAENLLPKWKKEGFVADVIIVDPPRTGCDPKLLETVIQMKPKRFVYVSCNPSTLAKDIAVLNQAGFELVEVQPVDMFPQTSHVEVVALLTWKANKFH